MMSAPPSRTIREYRATGEMPSLAAICSSVLPAYPGCALQEVTVIREAPPRTRMASVTLAGSSYCLFGTITSRFECQAS